MERAFRLSITTSLVWLLASAFSLAGHEKAVERGRWTRIPSSNELAQCQPAATDIPDGEVLLRCRVGANRRLSQCVVVSSPNARLTEWGRCLSGHFEADAAQVGHQVSIPLEWRRPS